MSSKENSQTNQIRMDFFRDRIRKKLSEIKDSIGEENYEAYCRIADECGDYDELRSLADLELQVEMANYIKHEILNKLNEDNVTIDELIEVNNNTKIEIHINKIDNNKDSNSEDIEDSGNTEEDNLCSAMIAMEAIKQLAKEEVEEELDSLQLNEDDLFGDTPDSDDVDAIEINEDDLFGDTPDSDDVDAIEINEDDLFGDTPDSDDVDAIEINEDDLFGDDVLFDDSIEIKDNMFKNIDDISDDDLSDYDDDEYMDKIVASDDIFKNITDDDLSDYDDNDEDIFIDGRDTRSDGGLELNVDIDEDELFGYDDDEDEDNKNDMSMEAKDIFSDDIFKNITDDDLSDYDDNDEDIFIDGRDTRSDGGLELNVDIDEDELFGYDDDEDEDNKNDMSMEAKDIFSDDIDINEDELFGYDDMDVQENDIFVESIGTSTEDLFEHRGKSVSGKDATTIKEVSVKTRSPGVRKITSRNILDNGTDRGKQSQKIFSCMCDTVDITGKILKKAKNKTKKMLRDMQNTSIFKMEDEDDEYIDF